MTDKNNQPEDTEVSAQQAEIDPIETTLLCHAAAR